MLIYQALSKCVHTYAVWKGLCTVQALLLLIIHTKLSNFIFAVRISYVMQITTFQEMGDVQIYERFVRTYEEIPL